MAAAIAKLVTRAVALAAALALICVVCTVSAATVADADTTYFVKLWSNKYPLKYVWSGSDICKYEGISCDTVKQTVAMFLPKIGLTGTIPTFGSRSRFTPANVNVVTMNLMSNPELTGTFPAHYGSVTKLQELYLMNTSLQGTIPLAWNNLANLAIIDVSYTKACGGLPAWDKTSMKSLQYMHFTGNSLMRGSVPSSLATFGAVSFNTSGCNLCGCIPSQFSTSIAMAFQLSSDQPQLRAQTCATANVCTADSLNCNKKADAAVVAFSRASVAAVAAGVVLAVVLAVV